MLSITYTIYFFRFSPENPIFILILSRGKLRLKDSSNLPKVAQLVESTAEIKARLSLTPELISRSLGYGLSTAQAIYIDPNRV